MKTSHISQFTISKVQLNYRLNEDEKEMSMTENRNRAYKRPEESKI